MALNENEVKARIKGFVSSNFLFGKENMGLKDGDSFLESGVVDSTGVLEIVDFLKETWDVEVADEELLPENLDSINNLAAFVGRKTAAR